MKEELTKQTTDSYAHNLRYPTKIYTRSSVTKSSTEFVQEKFLQEELWNKNKRKVYETLSERDMEHSA